MTNRKIVLLILLVLFPVRKFLSAPIDQRFSSDQKRYGLLNQRQAISKEWLTFMPGIQYRSTNLVISSPSGSKLRMPDEEINETRFFMDIKSKDFHLGEFWGAYLLYQNIPFQLAKQSIDSSWAGNFATGSGVAASGNRVRNLGTEVEGRIESLLPVFYIGDKEKEFFRIGLGLGPSKVQFRGNPDFNDGLSELIPFVGLSGSDSISSKIDRLGEIALIRSGSQEQDTINSYLLSNLNEGKNLEILTLYQLSQGQLDISKLNPSTLFLIQQITEGQLTALEIIGLASLGRSDMKFQEKKVASFAFFFEVPFYDVTFRFGYGGPIYYQENYRIRFHNIDLSAYIPIDI